MKSISIIFLSFWLAADNTEIPIQKSILGKWVYDYSLKQNSKEKIYLFTPNNYGSRLF